MDGQVLRGSEATIDLNADLGESFGPWTVGADETVLGLVTSASLACGFHAGDPTGMANACRRAARHQVVIGAHVGYRDLVGFGRRFLDIGAEDLRADVIYQIGALDGLARAAGTAVRYVKPHGALYTAIATNRSQAEAVVAAVVDYGGDLPLVGPPGSLALDLAAEAGLRTVIEAFADRGYQANGTLMPRSQPKAVITNSEQIAERAVALATTGQVTAADGSDLRINAESLCLHGDTPESAANARAVRSALTQAGVVLRPFLQ